MEITILLLQILILLRCHVSSFRVIPIKTIHDYLYLISFHKGVTTAHKCTEVFCLLHLEYSINFKNAMTVSFIFIKGHLPRLGHFAFSKVPSFFTKCMSLARSLFLSLKQQQKIQQILKESEAIFLLILIHRNFFFFSTLSI